MASENVGSAQDRERQRAVVSKVSRRVAEQRAESAPPVVSKIERLVAEQRATQAAAMAIYEAKRRAVAEAAVTERRATAATVAAKERRELHTIAAFAVAAYLGGAAINAWAWPWEYLADSPRSSPAGGDLDCDDFPGQVVIDGPDPHGLDADGDGIGCE